MASMSLQTSDYAAVSQKENDDESPDTPNDNQRRLRTLKSTVTPWIAHALLAAVNIFTFFYLLHMSPSQTRCAKLLSSWSPAFDANVVQYKTIPINGSDAYQNQFKGEPTKEIDDAWRNISSAVPGVRLSKEELGILNKPTREAVSIPEDAGGGYFGTLKVFQLLHCLDELRKVSYRNLYDELQTNNSAFNEIQWHADMDQCIDMLRFSLMCESDVSILPYLRQTPSQTSQADFSAVQQCRDFDHLLEWATSESNPRMVSLDKMLPGEEP